MKKEEVRVNITGLSATGKSCVMFEIYKALKIIGFEVELDLNDNLAIIDYGNEIGFMKQMLINEKKRIENVKKKSKIVLKDIQTKRNHMSDGEKAS
jgi:adenylylsulfate kinase-like enzyme